MYGMCSTVELLKVDQISFHVFCSVPIFTSVFLSGKQFSLSSTAENGFT